MIVLALLFSQGTSDVFVSGQGAYHTYRIPSLLVTRKGTVLAFSEGRRRSASDTGEIDVVLRRSEDHGATWGPTRVVWEDAGNTCGNPCPVVDRDTGTIWLLLTHNLGQDSERDIEEGRSRGTRTVWVSRSDDDGLEWSKPVEITKDVKKPGWTWFATGPGVGIQARGGRLVVPCDAKEAGGRKGVSLVLYSDDHGKEWHPGGGVGDTFGESQVAELSDGRLLLNMRNMNSPRRERGVATSADGGLTWSEPRYDPALVEPVCQASLMAGGPGLLLFSNPASAKSRVRMTVRLSRDDGKTWPAALELHPGPSAYSSLAVLADGRIGCLYECGGKSPYEKIVLDRFGLERLQGPGMLVASKEPGWPQWRGPRRDGISGEVGLLPSWPEGGPRLVWKSEDLGRGYSAAIVSGGSIFITGDVGEDLVITALDLEGRIRWKAPNGRAWTGEYPGARASCLLDEGRLYHLNAHGRVACLDAKTGRELWAADVLERFEGRVIAWGMSEGLLVDGPRLIVTPGGKKGAIAALDKKTGETAWASEPIEGNSAGYGSPILFEMGGRRHLVTCSSRHVFGVDADTGGRLWKRIRPSEYLALCFTPVLSGDGVYVTTPGKNGGTFYRLAVGKEGTRVDVGWDTRVDTLHGGTVLVDGVLYGSGHVGFKGWAALDAATGETRYAVRDLPSGAAVFADGRLYCQTERGEAVLVRPGPGGFEVAGRFPLVPERKQDAWAHPVLSDGRLYLRCDGTLFSFDIRAK